MFPGVNGTIREKAMEKQQVQSQKERRPGTSPPESLSWQGEDFVGLHGTPRRGP
jgi:hypothetical protein